MKELVVQLSLDNVSLRKAGWGAKLILKLSIEQLGLQIIKIYQQVPIVKYTGCEAYGRYPVTIWAQGWI